MILYQKDILNTSFQIDKYSYLPSFLSHVFIGLLKCKMVHLIFILLNIYHLFHLGEHFSEHLLYSKMRILVDVYLGSDI